LSSSVLFAVEIALYLFAFGLTLTSGYLVYRQRLTSFQIVRQFVLGVYVLIVILIALEFARVMFGGSALMVIYPGLSISVGLAQAMLLFAGAIAVYLEPINSSYKSFPSILVRAKKHAAMFMIFLAIATIAVLYIVLGPRDIVTATDMAGRSIPAMGVSHDSISLIVGLLGFFLGYPVLLLLLAARKIQIPVFSRSLTFLAIGWGSVSTVYVIVESYLWLYSVDTTAVLYSLNAVIFFLVTREFRNAAVLGGMVENLNTLKTIPNFSVRVGRQTGFLRGTVSLFEANPAVSYEITLRELAFEMASLKDSVFIITSKGSRVYQALSDLEQVRLFAMTSSVNHIVPTDKTSEVLIPAHDAPLLLDIVEKAVTASSTTNAVFVLDSLSDMILDLGFKETYQFVKQALEVCSNHNVTFVAIIFQNAHDIPILNAVRSLFSNHFVEDAQVGPRVSKFQDEPAFATDQKPPKKDEL
jgi:hypothetical protein